MKPLISIILAVYNGEKYITNAIKSVINQDYEQWELIIVNDGSFDQTKSLIEQFKDSRIRLKNQENLGVGAARNAALSIMEGVYFCFLDADDQLPTKSLSARLEVFDRSADIKYVDGAVAYYNEDMSQIHKVRKADYYGNPIGALCRLDERCFFGPTWMFKRIEKQNYTFEKSITHSEDLLFYLQYASEGKLACTQEMVLHYRTGNSSAMSNLDGLEEGYRYIYKKLASLKHVTQKDRQAYWLSSRSVMFKSYLGNFSLLKALKVLLYW